MYNTLMLPVSTKKVFSQEYYLISSDVTKYLPNLIHVPQLKYGGLSFVSVRMLELKFCL